MSKSIIEHGVTQSRARDIANDFIENRLHQYETKRNYDYAKSLNLFNEVYKFPDTNLFSKVISLFSLLE